MSVLREDIVLSVRSLQVCTEHDARCEAAVHTMRSLLGKRKY